MLLWCPPWRGLADVLVELFEYETVSPDALAATTSKDIYAAFMDTPRLLRSLS